MVQDYISSSSRHWYTVHVPMVGLTTERYLNTFSKLKFDSLLKSYAALKYLNMVVTSQIILSRSADSRCCT